MLLGTPRTTAEVHRGTGEPDDDALDPRGELESVPDYFADGLDGWLGD